ncbi:MAG: AlpA family phage regulatory protein [Candidatus Competibacteraceae bacterium]
MKVLGLRRTALWHLRKSPDFPKPLGLTRALSWRAVDIQRWLEQRLAQADDLATQTQQQG